MNLNGHGAIRIELAQSLKSGSNTVKWINQS